MVGTFQLRVKVARVAKVEEPPGGKRGGEDPADWGAAGESE